MKDHGENVRFNLPTTPEAGTELDIKIGEQTTFRGLMVFVRTPQFADHYEHPPTEDLATLEQLFEAEQLKVQKERTAANKD